MKQIPDLDRSSQILEKIEEMKKSGEMVWLTELASRLEISKQLLRYYLYPNNRPSGKGGHLNGKFKIVRKMGNLKLIEAIEDGGNGG